MNHAQLQGKNVDELREIAKALKIKPHPRAKADTLISQILQQPVAYQNKAMEHKAQETAKPVHNNTPEMVLDAIKVFAAKEGFVADFPDDGTWVFKYKGAEDSGNLSIPLRLIKQKAESVSRGRRAPIGAPRDTFDPIVGKGYANTVLMG